MKCFKYFILFHSFFSYLSINAQNCSDCSSWTPDYILEYSSEWLDDDILDFLADPTITNKKIEIDNSFALLSPISFVNCEIRVDQAIYYDEPKNINGAYEFINCTICSCSGGLNGFRGGVGVSSWTDYETPNVEFVFRNTTIIGKEIFHLNGPSFDMKDCYLIGGEYSHILHLHSNLDGDNINIEGTTFELYGELGSGIAIVDEGTNFNIGNNSGSPNTFISINDSAIQIDGNCNVKIENTEFYGGEKQINARGYIEIDNCIFQDAGRAIETGGEAVITNSNFDDNQIGVLIRSGSLDIQGCTLHGSDVGVKTSFTSQSYAPIRLSSNNFSNNIDFWSTGLSAVECVNNSFNGSQYGFLADGENEFYIHLNDFNNSIIGSLVYSTSGGLTEQFQNYINSDIGIHTVNQNSGYKFYDNCFSSRSEDINVAGDIFEDQGDEEVGAGNCFSGPGVIDINSESYFKYHVPLDLEGSCFDPVYESAYVQEEADRINNSDCGSDFPPVTTVKPFCFGGIKDCASYIKAVGEMSRLYKSILNNTNLSKSVKANLLQRYRSCLIRLVWLRGRYCGRSFYNALSESEDLFIQVSLIDIMIVNQEYVDALDYANSLKIDHEDKTKTEELKDYIAYQKINIRRLQNGKDFLLTAQENNFLHAFAKSIHPKAAYARSFLHLVNDELIYPDIDLLDYKFSRRSVQKKSDELKLYPNPTTGTLHIDIDARDCYQISLFSSDGILIDHIEGLKGFSKLNTDDYASGLYFLIIEYATGERETRKISILND